LIDSCRPLHEFSQHDHAAGFDPTPTFTSDRFRLRQTVPQGFDDGF
jgi:hypothetical protein